MSQNIPEPFDFDKTTKKSGPGGLLPARPWASALIGLILLLAVGYGTFQWFFCKVYVEPGEALQLRYKGPLLKTMIGFQPKTAKPGHFADPEQGEVGIVKELRGPGRHFYNPIYWERKIVRMADNQGVVIVNPGEVGIVTSKIGDPLPAGEFLVDGNLNETQHKGVLRKVFSPGKYRYNPYAYDFKKVTLTSKKKSTQTKHGGWVEIATGYVGVVTNLSDNALTGAKKGIQQHVLPPGLYPINPEEQEVDIVEIGLRETTIKCELKHKNGVLLVDEAGEPMVADSSDGIDFPSSDGFQINMDFTAVWGVWPEHAAEIVVKFGSIEAVEHKVLIPQVESIGRNNGSKYKAVDLLVGEERQKFQEAAISDIKKILVGKNITLRRALVRNIFIPQEVRAPIQAAFIADELKLTRNQEQLTAQEEAKLREAERQVDLESQKVKSETTKLVAEQLAEGHKTVGETSAETERLVAAIEKETAIIEAQATVVKGEAEASGDKMVQESQAQRFRLAVEAFGTAEAYNSYIFANGLPEQIDLKLLYAGPGTLWTDMKNLSVIVDQPTGKTKEQPGLPNRQHPTTKRPPQAKEQ